MLIYHGHGLRRYDLYPVGLMSRRPYEFQAVIRGEIAMVTPEGPGLLRGRRLWLSAPGYSHGWTGARGAAAEVAVFHFQLIPAVLERLTAATGVLEMELSAGQARRLRALSALSLRYADPPSAGTPLFYEQLLMELSLMMLDSVGREKLAAADEASGRVERAMRWYSRRLEENPSLEEVAKEAGCSPATLRRAFHSVMRASPKAVFDQLRFQRAMQMILEPGAKIEAVGVTCGFGSASAFSRAFRHKMGLSPESWRSGASPRRSGETSRG